MPVDLYVGGVEHAVLHLLYARFWHKVLYDLGYVSTKEPFQRLFNQGMVLAHSYRDKKGKYYHPSDTIEKAGSYLAKETGEVLDRQIEKMSKSKLNVVNPDEVIDDYGADSMRLYELFMGPLEASAPWQMDGVEGVYRFLARAWRLIVDEQTGALNNKLTDLAGDTEKALQKTLHKTIKKVSEDTENFHFNTAISQMMVFVNEASVAKTLPYEIVTTFLKLLNVYAPHVAEELWEKLGQQGLLCQQAWPEFNKSLCVDETVTIALQINGKTRGTFEAPHGADKSELEELALRQEKVQSKLSGATPKRVIVVPNRLVNIVV
jgi:leucyl-tRNA synthetase